MFGAGDEVWTRSAWANPEAVQDRQRHLPILPSGGRGGAWDDLSWTLDHVLEAPSLLISTFFASSGVSGIIPLLVLPSMPKALDVDCQGLLEMAGSGFSHLLGSI